MPRLGSLLFYGPGTGIILVVHIFTMKELVIRRVKFHSEEPRHLAAGTGLARLRRRFSFILQSRHHLSERGRHLCRQGVTFSSSQQLYPPNLYRDRNVSGMGGASRGGDRGE